MTEKPTATELPTPPNDLLERDGLESFVHRLHQALVTGKMGIGHLPYALLLVLQNPCTGEVLADPGLARVSAASGVPTSNFVEAIRTLASKSAALACVVVTPVAVSEVDGFGRILEEAMAPALLYLVEHENPDLSGLCWTATLTLDSNDDVTVCDDLESLGEPAHIGDCPFQDLLPKRTRH
ncbi:MAG: hypothetical protein GWN84_13230 [Gammaproteobacteria bacterium]|nr:hypothetical protein [Gammaproteobacteria bacterium]NIR83792.1 hypothetical protein [Gammaproteobacteria bacterium]NIU05118.1 hypothetical protein [Gammaproteobacteria bacterium]NIV51955.1 hypothetical protein [Gammaproteobacteria bacterium]NIX86391.1 hypothetical protein [Gammaproteobacteria bacterium]